MKHIKTTAAGVAVIVAAALATVGVENAHSADAPNPHEYDHSTTEVTTEYPDGPPIEGKNRPAPHLRASTTSHELAYQDSLVEIVLEDPATGAAQAKRKIHFGRNIHHKTMRINRAIRVLSAHGTGGTSSVSGRVKVTITQFGRSALGAKLWTMKDWTDWSWLRATQKVFVRDQGRWWDINDDAWDFVKWTKQGNHSHYYDWAANNGHPHSAYEHTVQAEFTGPAVAIHTAHEFPLTWLHSYYNGTNEWETD